MFSNGHQQGPGVFDGNRGLFNGYQEGLAVVGLLPGGGEVDCFGKKLSRSLVCYRLTIRIIGIHR